MKPVNWSYWLRSGAYTFLEKFSLKLFRFGSFYFLVRALSREHFGIWTLFLIISSFVEVARIGFIQNALVKFLASTEEPRIRGRINTASLILNFMLTIVSGTLLFIIAQIQPTIIPVRQLDEMIYVYIFTTFALIPFFQFNFIQQANFDFKGIFLSNFVRQGIFFLYVLYGFLSTKYEFSTQYELKLMHLAAFQVVCAASGSLVAIIVSRKYHVFSYRLDIKWMKWLFSYGKFVVGTHIGSMLIKNIDQLMLGVLMSPIAVAIYGTAVKIASLIEVPIQAMAAVVFPKSAQKIEKEGIASAKPIYEKSVGVILAMVLPMLLFVLLFPEWILRFVAGERYLDAVPVLQVSMLFGLFVPSIRQFGIMMDAMGKPKINFILVMLSAIINVGLNYFLITKWGVIGAAFATLITFILIFIANHVILYKKMNVKPQNSLWYAGKVYKNGYTLLRQKIVSLAK